MLASASLANFVETIRVAVAPVFLLTGLASLLGVVTSRPARIIDRARVLGSKPESETSADQRMEMRRIPSRIMLINLSILLAALATLAVCLVIVLLFVSSLIDLHIGIAVAVAFIIAMLLLMGSLVSFIAEVRLALSLLYVPTNASADELLAAGAKPET